jgi:hypothetical protein
MQVQIHTGSLSFKAEFNMSLTAQMIVKGLPMESRVSLWGDQVNFETGVQASDFNANYEVKIGDIAYWHEKKSLCLFFGKTPSSTDDRPVPQGPMVVVGKILCQPQDLSVVKEGDVIRVTAIEQKPVAVTFDPLGNERKLSQPEIDRLVQKLLDEKKRIAQKTEQNKPT